MFSLNEQTKGNISRQLQKNLGITYEEYRDLSFEQQQQLINEYHKKTVKNQNVVMLGSGEHSFFTTIEKGKKIMLGSGDTACFVRVGINRNEIRREPDDKMDDFLCSKPMAYVKRIQRRLKK